MANIREAVTSVDYDIVWQHLKYDTSLKPLSTNNTDVFLKTLQCLGRTAVFSISLYCV
jgi:hypothetical protein